MMSNKKDSPVGITGILYCTLKDKTDTAPVSTAHIWRWLAITLLHCLVTQKPLTYCSGSEFRDTVVYLM